MHDLVKDASVSPISAIPVTPTGSSPLPEFFSLDLGRIAQDLQIRKVQVESVVKLLDDGNTVPFITRYRKERTGGLDEEQIRAIEWRIKQQRLLGERRQTILKNIQAQGVCAEDQKEEIAVKNSQEFNEQYNVWTSDGYVRLPPGAYESTCFPAQF